MGQAADFYALLYVEFKGVRIRRMRIILLSRYLILKINTYFFILLKMIKMLLDFLLTFIFTTLTSSTQIVIEIRKPTYFCCDLHVHSSHFLLVTQQQPVSTYPVHYSRQKERLAKPYIYFNFIYPLSTSETNTIQLQLCSARQETVLPKTGNSAAVTGVKQVQPSFQKFAIS